MLSPGNHKKGFTLILALMILILLSTLMALFITMVSTNLRQSQNALKVSTIELLAMSGIDYCNNMLMHSPKGADWRPDPDNISMKADWTPNLSDPMPLEADVSPDLEDISKDDPDYRWLIPYWPVELKTADDILYAGPSGGYTRVNSNDGRFLIKVSYNPASFNTTDKKYISNYYDTESKYIKIESVGRLGIVDPDDPTTMGEYGNPNKRLYLVAYKPLGITDYLRFVTNKDRKNVVFNLGSGIMNEVFGRDKTRYNFRGAPLRFQSDLLIDPKVNIFLRGRKLDTGSSGTVVSPRDMIEVTGDIIDFDTILNSNMIDVFDEDGTTSNPLAASANDLKGYLEDYFIKQGGASDGSGVAFIDAPVLDTKDTSGTTLRYRALTKDSGRKISGTGKNSGEYGWGSGIYIDNNSDVQRESETLFGGYSLRADWLNPGNLFSKNWKGPYYIPPGVVIVLNPDVAQGITITRTDFDSRSLNKVWYDAAGNPRPDWGATINVPYPIDGEVRSFDGVSYPDWIDPAKSKIKGNGVIYAEGNIRIKGMVPENVQLTVVSNENIYIEGNILKNRKPGTPINEALDLIGQTSSPVDHRSSISLLARNNVVVNTTMFLSPGMSLGPEDVASDSDTLNEPPFHMVLSPLSYGRNFQWSFMFGPYESEEDLFPDIEADGWKISMRHSSQYGLVDAYLDTFDYSIFDWKPVDWGAEISNPYYLPGTFFSDKLRINGGLDPGSLTANSDWIYYYHSFGLTNSDFDSANPVSVDQYEYLRIFIDNYSKGDYIMGNVAITPLDVRIEALNYAQNGSFFVIPGYWFNPDSNYKADSSNDKKNFWQMGESIDVKITIDGAISENMMADKSDQISWMEKWGDTFEPAFYKSSASTYPSYHNGSGLTILYDDYLAYPVVDNEPIRYDRYARMLPITPKLPVSSTLIYKGRLE